MTRASFVIASFASLVVGASTHGALLGLTIGLPDITSGFIDVNYVAGTDQFTASGFASTLTMNVPPPTSFNIAGGGFSLSATINDLGVATAGSLAITGTVLGNPSPLLTGILAPGNSFGFQTGGGDTFEFLFLITGGSLATPSFYGNIGSTVGVIMDSNFRPTGGFAGSWTSSFNNNGGQAGFGTGVSDTGTVPAPAATALLALLGLVGSSRRRTA